MDVIIREALPSENEILTNISFASKRYWNYPENYFKVWEDELTISEKYISENVVYVAEAKGAVAAYYSIVEVEADFWAGKTFVQKGFWLEHMFVIPEFIGRGIGKELYAHAKQYCRQNDIAQLMIFADPNAKGFYEKMGVQYQKECPSSIEGRNVSLFVTKL